MIEPYPPHSEEPPPLSQAGAARREAMLAALQREVPRIAAARQQRRRIAGVAAVVILLAGGAWLASLQVAAPLRTPAINPSASGSQWRAGIEIVATRVDVAQVSITDDELLAALASMGRPTGLARIGDRVILTAPVTDAERAAQPGLAPPPGGSNPNHAGAAAAM